MIKVYLLVGKTTFYKDLINHPPMGIEYLPKKNYDYAQDISTYYSVTQNMKRKIASILMEKFKLPRITYIFNYTSDIIHSNRGILILNRKPWVIDTDYISYFFGSSIFDKNINMRLRGIVTRFLESEYCKKIICWSDATRLSVVNTFESDKIINKTEVVYPAIPVIKKIRRKKDDKIKIIYVSSLFYLKGGKELLSAFKILLKKYDNIELTFKCDVPENIKQSYNFKEIHFIPYRSQLLPRDELIKNFYMNSDIFVYPTIGDLFGLNLLDAMVAELPIVTTNTFAIPEIVEEGKNGFVLNPPKFWYNEKYLPRRDVLKNFNDETLAKIKFPNFVNQLAKKISFLIEDESLRKKMGRCGRRLVEKGKFSIKERNKKLASIYLEALRR